ncbi:MAG: Ig-like domain-containing protein [Puia sp.]
MPGSIVIQFGDQAVEKISRLSPISLSVIIKNKEGKPLNGVPVSFTASQNGGSVSAASQNTDPFGVAQTTWTLSAQPDSAEHVVAKVIYNNIDLSVTFYAAVVQDSLYNFTGTLTMDSTNEPALVIGYYDTTNRPDPFTIASDSMALTNSIPYPIELDSIRFPNFQQGEHGENGSSVMTINQFVYPPVQVSYEVGGLIIMEVTTTKTYTVPEPYTVTMYWQLRGSDTGGRISGIAYLLETVSSPTKGSFTNGRTGQFVTTGRLLR